MANFKNCKLYYTDSPDFLVEYRGNFKEEISKITYACGDVLTNTLAVISTPYENLARLQQDVPSIIYIDQRRMFIAQDISPSDVDNINNIKINPYLNLTGKNVLIGMVDTGIDYLNQEFIREDGTSRVENLWDQSIEDYKDTSVYVGVTYTNEQINSAINAKKNNQDPYAIVPSKDIEGHGTKIAGIIGARGYNGQFQGISIDSNFVIVKLLESTNFKNRLAANGVDYVPIYNNSEVVAAIEYLKNYSIKVQKPMVIFIGVGTTEGSHDGNNLVSRYITAIGTIRGIVAISGTGNEGASEGHASGSILNQGDISTVELRISKEMQLFTFDVWVRIPNTASINVISPNGEESKFIKSKIDKTVTIKFIFLNTTMTVAYFTPEHYTGHEMIQLSFTNMRPGIWVLQLRGEYITDGRYDIWLPPAKTLPPGTKFLNSDPNTTLTIPSTARKVGTIAYFGNNSALIPTSGKGFNADDVIINPDIATLGVNILTTQPSGGVTTVTGSSAAAGIVAGACALLLQWGVINGNDTTMYSTKVITYLIHGADRSNPAYRYPNREIGYGKFDLVGTFDIISRNYRVDKSLSGESRQSVDDLISWKDENHCRYFEFYFNNLFIRIPKENMEEYYEKN
ncbi:S8 family peptidase [Inconstantimicrobium mannanitabidum]|uniref:Uncharacterized protein n=1 Tax=Inconstantimicrobium mannanitabidum TaxID=1604901 RepID=A0ACB5REC5_9CLOT|nr:S8 family serine peptidase [Clostridium sp. TW13]GKX67114.1 hypothetical protein rsdtw13_23720 [Clostridium sp. TW13]